MSFNKLLFVSLLLISFSLAAFGQSAPQSKTVTILGAKIHYLEAGDAARPTVILLHGLGANADSWRANIPAIAANYHVIAPDQIGFGQSDKPLIAYRVETYIDFLEKFMTELKIEKASLAGNSLGGWVAVWFTAKNPSKVEKLVLVDAAGYAPPKDFNLNQLDDLNPSTREGTRRLANAVFYDQKYSSDFVVDALMTARIQTGDGWTIKMLIDSIKRGEGYIDDKVKSIKTPTLIVWGKQDGLINIADGERYHKEIANSTLVVFDQCGHVPQLEKFTEFNKQVMEFLAK